MIVSFYCLRKFVYSVQSYSNLVNRDINSQQTQNEIKSNQNEFNNPKWASLRLVEVIGFWFLKDCNRPHLLHLEYMVILDRTASLPTHPKI